jgi:CBS domain-containing protein
MTSKPTLARDIMVSRLITLRPDMDVFDAIDRLLKHQISGAPVVDEFGNFVGVFSERCSISLLVAAAYDGAPTNRIEPFIERDVATISPDTDLLTIAERFLNSNQRRLPVLDAGRLVGQVSRRDVLKAAQSLLQQPVMVVEESNLLYLSGVVARKDAPIA